MHILTPLNDISSLEDLICAGADEFYFGFYDKEWIQRFGTYTDINRMSGFGQIANKYSFEEILVLISKIEEFKKHSYLTLNASVYSKECIEYIQNYYLPAAISAGLSGVIVSDTLLASIIVESGLKAIASTIYSIYNADQAALAQKWGFKRVILPRDMTLSEIYQITDAVPDLEYEVFFMRNGCSFSDGYCLGTHRIGCGSTCGFLRTTGKKVFGVNSSFFERHSVELNDLLYEDYFHKVTCGLCALYRLDKMGIKALKIVGRADNMQQVLEDIRLTKTNIERLSSCASEQEYLEKMEMPANQRKICKLGLSCYYPEVRFS